MERGRLSTSSYGEQMWGNSLSTPLPAAMHTYTPTHASPSPSQQTCMLLAARAYTNPCIVDHICTYIRSNTHIKPQEQTWIPMLMCAHKHTLTRTPRHTHVLPEETRVEQKMPTPSRIHAHTHMHTHTYHPPPHTNTPHSPTHTETEQKVQNNHLE